MLPGVENVPSHDYIFVDESGDPGYSVDASGVLSSSPYYVAAAFHVCDDTFGDLNSHVAAFRYLAGLSRELKIPPKAPPFDPLMKPIAAMADGGKNIWASVVYLDKATYTGRYLKPGGHRPQDPVLFRNHILRCPLEFHFLNHRLATNQWDLVLDRITLTESQAANLQGYLAGNYNIPTPTHITHAASIYVEALQIVHHIAAGFGDVALGSGPSPILRFVKYRDVTTDQFIYKPT